MTTLNSDELIGKLTPEGNDALEQCPFCRRLNSPGACDVCEHFFGSYWDGEIIGSEAFEEFDAEWSELSSLVEELEDSLGKTWKQLLRLAKLGMDASKLKNVEPGQSLASSALIELVDFASGPQIVTTGMLSGEGNSFYIMDPSVISTVISDVGRIRGKLAGLRSGSVGELTHGEESSP